MATNFDLSTLNLADGSYTVTIVAKGMNLKDSEQSAAVSYTIEPSTVTIPSGTYVANDSFTIQSIGTQNINFTSNSINYTSMHVSSALTYGATLVYERGAWTNDNYKTVKLDTDQTVGVEFGDWFNENFEKQPDARTVTISFAKGYNGAMYVGTEIYDDFDVASQTVSGNKIGEIPSVTHQSDGYYGSTTVETTTGKLAVCISSDWLYETCYIGTVDITGDIINAINTEAANSKYLYQDHITVVPYIVNSDGSVTLNNVDFYFD